MPKMNVLAVVALLALYDSVCSRTIRFSDLRSARIVFFDPSTWVVQKSDQPDNIVANATDKKSRLAVERPSGKKLFQQGETKKDDVSSLSNFLSRSIATSSGVQNVAVPNQKPQKDWIPWRIKEDRKARPPVAVPSLNAPKRKKNSRIGRRLGNKDRESLLPRLGSVYRTTGKPVILGPVAPSMNQLFHRFVDKVDDGIYNTAGGHKTTTMLMPPRATGDSFLSPPPPPPIAIRNKVINIKNTSSLRNSNGQHVGSLHHTSDERELRVSGGTPVLSNNNNGANKKIIHKPSRIHSDSVVNKRHQSRDNLSSKIVNALTIPEIEPRKTPGRLRNGKPVRQALFSLPKNWLTTHVQTKKEIGGQPTNKRSKENTEVTASRKSGDNISATNMLRRENISGNHIKSLFNLPGMDSFIIQGQSKSVPKPNDDLNKMINKSNTLIRYHVDGPNKNRNQIIVGESISRKNINKLSKSKVPAMTLRKPQPVSGHAIENSAKLSFTSGVKPKPLDDSDIQKTTLTPGVKLKTSDDSNIQKAISTLGKVTTRDPKAIKVTEVTSTVAPETTMRPSVRTYKTTTTPAVIDHVTDHPIHVTFTNILDLLMKRFPPKPHSSGSINVFKRGEQITIFSGDPLNNITVTNPGLDVKRLLKAWSDKVSQVVQRRTNQQVRQTVAGSNNLQNVLRVTTDRSHGKTNDPWQKNQQTLFDQLESNDNTPSAPVSLADVINAMDSIEIPDFTRSHQLKTSLEIQGDLKTHLSKWAQSAKDTGSMLKDVLNADVNKDRRVKVEVSKKLPKVTKGRNDAGKTKVVFPVNDRRVTGDRESSLTAKKHIQSAVSAQPLNPTMVTASRAPVSHNGDILVPDLSEKFISGSISDVRIPDFTKPHLTRSSVHIQEGLRKALIQWSRGNDM